MSPVKAVKDAGEFASPWAVIAMVAYMIYTGQAGGGINADDIAKVAATAAAQVQKAPSGDVVDIKFGYLTDAIGKTVNIVERIDEKIDPMIRLAESNARRLDAIEGWIARQEGRN